MELSELLRAMASLQESFDELSGKFDTQQQVIERIEENRRENEANRKDNRVNRVLAVFAIIGFVLDVTLTGFVWHLHDVEDANTSALRTVQSRTNSQILCPLYQVIAQSIKANPSPPGLSPDLVQFRKSAAQIITDGLNTLGCTP